MHRLLLASAAVLGITLASEARAGCAVTPLASLPIADTAHFLTLSGAIDGQAVSLLMDTGADTALITPEAAGRLNLAADPARVTQIIGTGGPAGISPHVLIGRLALGALAVEHLSAPLGALPAVPRVLPPVAGLLGADLLSRFDLDLDLPGRRMTLYAVAEAGSGGVPCATAVLPPWTGPFDTVALRRLGDRLIAPVRIDGEPASALIDTGARSILVSTQAASRLGVGPDQLATDAGGITGGVDLRDVSFHWHRFATLQIGTETIRNPVLTVSAFSEQADMLLGAPFFATRRVWLSYATGRMFIQRAAAAR
ncbi:MAG: aspartyl protease family protein [Acetobacteraceae bacterium]|nr:aspartyl protease family protein [Acetobacteraceae bacterium]